MKRGIRMVALLVLICNSCKTDNTLSPMRYIQYMENEKNGMLKKVAVGNAIYEIQFATPEYVVSKEADMEKGANIAILKNRLKELRPYLYVYITLKDKDGVSRTDEVATAYYNLAASNDIKLFSGGKCSSPIEYQYENNYGLAPNKILTVFENLQETERMFVVFNDRHKANLLIKAAVDENVIKNLPQLEIK